MNRAFIGRLAVAAVIVLLLAGTASGSHLNNSVPIDGEVPFSAPNGPTVTLVGPMEVNATNMFPQSDTVRVWSTEGNVTVSGDPGDVTIDEINGTWTRTSSLDVIGNEITIDPGDKAAVTVEGDVSWLDFRAMTPDDGTPDFNYSSAFGSATVTVRGLPTNTPVAAIDASSGALLSTDTTDGSGEATFSSLDGGSHDVLIQTSEGSPTISNPSPTGGLSTATPTLEIDVTDPDFPGDELSVEWYVDGSNVHTDTVTSNGTVSYTTNPLTGGNHTWHVKITDAYDNQVSSQTVDVSTPAELEVYYELDPETLVDDENVSINIRFFELEGESVVTRPLNNGTVSLTGLPVDTGFVVTVPENASDNIAYRRTYIPSIFETQRMFVLRENASTSTVVFELQDPTGEFPPQDTVLVIEKPLEINGTTGYWPIAGDTFGATSRFPAVLETGSRYRLRVISDESERIIGAYNVYGSTTEIIKIQRIEPRGEDRDTGVFDATLSGGTLSVEFRGGEPTSSVTYNITDNSGQVVVPDTTSTGASFAHVYQVSANGSAGYTVHYTITRPDGATVSDTIALGRLGGLADRFNIDPKALAIMSWVAILASMGLVVVVDRTLAPAVGTGVATVGTIIGTVNIPPAFLGVAGAIAVLTIVGGRQ